MRINFSLNLLNESNLHFEFESNSYYSNAQVDIGINDFIDLLHIMGDRCSYLEHYDKVDLVYELQRLMEILNGE